MKKEYEITLAKYYFDCKHYYEVSDDIAIEDVRFIKFTELLDTANVFKNPKYCRYEGTGLKNTKWSLLGYAFTNDIVSDEEDEENDDDSNMQKEYEWNFTFFNGFFSGENSIINSKKSDIQKAVSDTAKFIEATLSGNSKFMVQDYHPISELQEHVLNLDRKKLLDRIDICIITDNLIEHENLDTNIFIESLQRDFKIHYWGINKWSDLARSKSKRLPINLDFVGNGKMNYEVSSLEQKNNNDDVKYYLSIFPGDLIADLYDDYDTQLLENNVRVFLSLKSKYNREMSKTIIGNERHMFFSYNNGISATASKIKINSNTKQIESISDFQIVNGGQTTATLYHTKKHLKKSLSDINVQVKITVLKKTENYAVLIKNISRFANSQTAVKLSDFWTNDSYLIDFEKLSLRNPVQIDGSFFNYFFERMAGQYKETRSRKGTKRDISSWEKQNPKKYSFNKIELARWFNAMNLQPHIAVSSAEKQFETFMKKEDKPILTISKYKTVIGFGQLCERARKVTGKASSKEFPPIIDDPNVGMATSVYAISYFHFITGGRFDYHKIFDHRLGVEELDGILKSIIKKCWDQIYQYDRIYTRDKTKVEACWKFVKERVELSQTTLDKLRKYLVSAKEHKKRESKDLSEEEYYFTNLKQLLIKNGKILYSMLDFATTNNNLFKYRILVKNTIERINSKTGVITLAKLKELIAFKDELADYDLLGAGKFPKKIDIDLLRINEKVFVSRTSFLQDLEGKVALKSGEDFEKQMFLLEEIKELTEKFDLYPGLSISDMERMEEILDFFGI